MSDKKMSYREIREIIDENNKQVNAKLDRLIEKTDAIHIQATKTNGRVNRLELKEPEYDRRLEDLERSDKQQDVWINTTQGKIIIVGVALSLAISIGVAIL